MSEEPDSGEKSFEPTPQKLLRAREKGDLPRSNDINASAAYLGLILTLWLLGPSVLSRGAPGMLSLLSGDADAWERAAFLAGETGLAAGLLFVLPIACVTIGLIWQRAIVIVPSKLQFKADRISPVSNFKQKYGPRGLFEFAKSAAKLLAYCGCLAVFVMWRLKDLVSSVGLSAGQVSALLFQYTVEFMMLAFAVSLVISVIDYAWQVHEHRKRNMMSRKEIQDEHKESEGDPHTKQARQARGREIATSADIAKVPTADVVIVNPTHVSVALKWSRAPGAAPVCVAKGQDAIALRMREIARENAVPIYSDPPTARALLATVETGAEIRPEHYAPVAIAIRYAEDMRKRAMRGVR